MKIGPGFYDSLKGMDLDAIEELEPGPNGYHLEPGFEPVEDATDEDGNTLPPAVFIVVPAILCRSDQHPTPQYRYVSPYEAARGRLEVADRMVCVRIDVADQDLSELVIGRTDDVRDELAEAASGAVGSRLRRFVTGAGGAAFRRVGGFIGRLVGLVRGALG